MARNLVGILLIAAALGTALFWTRPMWASVQVLEAKKGELKSAIKRFQELKKVRDDLLAKYNSISAEDLSRLEAFMPKTSEPGPMLVNIEKLTEENRVVLKNVNITREAETEQQGRPGLQTAPGKGGSGAALTVSHSVLPLDITVSGSYESFRIFLRAVEKNLRLIDVELITFSPSEIDNYEFSIRASVYWHKR